MRLGSMRVGKKSTWRRLVTAAGLVTGWKRWLWLGGLGGLGAAGAGWRYMRVGGGRLGGQVALVTGGSRGLGLLLACELAQEGCKVAICARDPDELARAERYLEGHGADVLGLRCDVSKREEVEAMIAAVEARWGGIDVLVNNAGIIQVGPLETMTIQDFEQAMGVNFWGSVYTTMAVLPGMRARHRGRIVNITSIGGKVAVPHLLPYDCAKFAAMGFSEGLRAETAKDGISVTTVVPGLMRTGGHLHAMFKGKEESEYAWFKTSATVPVTAMDARRAARRIIDATARRKAEVTVGWNAKLLRLFHGLFPGLTTRFLAGANRALPGAAGGRRRAIPGRRLEGAHAPV